MKENQLARQAARDFAKPLNARSIEGLLRAADVPFLGRGGVIKDRAALRKFLTDVLAKLPKGEKYPTQPVGVLIWGRIRAGIDCGDIVKQVDSVLGEKDRLVSMGEGRGFYVRIRGGKAAVVGGW